MQAKPLDRLQTIFELQESLQKRLGSTYDQAYISTMTLAAVDELMEALRETPWKPWKKQQAFNKDEYKKELVDLLHFFVNLCLAAGMTADELFNKYCEKNGVNFKRQEDGY
jgi:dimeric dUTPase (all-alpha-NTP-PPase superfamily)